MLPRATLRSRSRDFLRNSCSPRCPAVTVASFPVPLLAGASATLDEPGFAISRRRLDVPCEDAERYSRECCSPSVFRWRGRHNGSKSTSGARPAKLRQPHKCTRSLCTPVRIYRQLTQPRAETITFEAMSTTRRVCAFTKKQLTSILVGSQVSLVHANTTP